MRAQGESLRLLPAVVTCDGQTGLVALLSVEQAMALCVLSARAGMVRSYLAALVALGVASRGES